MSNESNVNVRMPEAMKAYLESVAKAQTLSLSDVIRRMILERMPPAIQAMHGWDVKK